MDISTNHISLILHWYIRFSVLSISPSGDFFSKQSISICLDSLRRKCLLKMHQKLRNMKILTAYISAILHLSIAYWTHLLILDVDFFSKDDLNIYLDIISMKYLLKMAQNLKNQTLFYFYLGDFIDVYPKNFSM